MSRFFKAGVQAQINRSTQIGHAGCVMTFLLVVIALYHFV
jgi:hypothetical protein